MDLAHTWTQGQRQGHKEVRPTVPRALRRPRGLPSLRTGLEPTSPKSPKVGEIPSAGLPSRTPWNTERALLPRQGGDPDLLP